MKKTAILEEKKKHLSRIIVLCDLEEGSYRLNVENSRIVCLLIFLIPSIILFSSFGIRSAIPCLAYGLFITLIVYPKLEKTFKSTSEKMYISLYTYTSPLPDSVTKQNNGFLMNSLKSDKTKDHYYIKEWAIVELETINDIIFTETKTGKLRELIIEREETK